MKRRDAGISLSRSPFAISQYPHIVEGLPGKSEALFSPSMRPPWPQAEIIRSGQGFRHCQQLAQPLLQLLDFRGVRVLIEASRVKVFGIHIQYSSCIL